MKWIDPRVDHKYCRKNRGGRHYANLSLGLLGEQEAQLMEDRAWAVVLFVLLMAFMINLIGGAI